MSKLRYSVIILFIVFNLTQCISQEISISDKPEEELAKLLNENKVVMLGDFGHHTAETYYSLLRALDKYFQTDNPENVSVIMEMDSLYANKLSGYLRHGSVDTLFDIYYRANLEDIEFWTTLKNFNDWLEKKANKRDLLKIKAFETVIDENFYRITTREADLWYISKRDSITAAGIINYVKNNPDEKILIFYGNAHLLDSLQSKAAYIATDEERKGYYLVHYLRKEFGKDKVVTVNQFFANSLMYMNPILEKYNSDVFIKTSLLPFKEINTGNYDYTILRRILVPASIPPHPLSMIFSRRGIEKTVSKLVEMEKIPGFMEGHFKFEYNELLDKIYMITGRKFGNSEELNEWYNKNLYDGMKRLTSSEFKEFIFNYIYEDWDNFNKQKRINLFELGFGPGILDAPLMTKEEWKAGEDWAFEIVKFHNAVTVYWLGYPDEKEKAKEILTKFTGLIFENPVDYLKWFRRTYYLRDY